MALFCCPSLSVSFLAVPFVPKSVRLNNQRTKGNQKKKLTDLTIRRAAIEAKAYTLCDGAGLYLNRKSNVTKQWLYRFYWEGIQKRISLGLYPSVDLKKARSLRQQAQDMLINGINPRTGRKSSSKTSYIQEKMKWLLS